ncbi:hypothetical protein BDP27DRAFT_1418536 [Rhodocollybia butyracea]|uniref:Uncharacterized protein n=1 Tax=Rhodocollybia butyracea TaxID=206335 RepID=A0A9P5UAF7_9AGAR|nr:hypothetical protein BDP27DRAFT_1418536 [Rhodocollybia butyracea]
MKNRMTLAEILHAVARQEARIRETSIFSVSATELSLVRYLQKSMLELRETAVIVVSRCVLFILSRTTWSTRHQDNILPDTQTFRARISLEWPRRQLRGEIIPGGAIADLFDLELNDDHDSEKPNTDTEDVGDAYDIDAIVLLSLKSTPLGLRVPVAGVHPPTTNAFAYLRSSASPLAITEPIPHRPIGFWFRFFLHLTFCLGRDTSTPWIPAASLYGSPYPASAYPGAPVQPQAAALYARGPYIMSSWGAVVTGCIGVWHEGNPYVDCEGKRTQ